MLCEHNCPVQAKKTTDFFVRLLVSLSLHCWPRWLGLGLGPTLHTRYMCPCFWCTNRQQQDMTRVWAARGCCTRHRFRCCMPRRRAARRPDARCTTAVGSSEEHHLTEVQALSHRANATTPQLAADIDSMKRRLQTAGYLQPAGGNQDAGASSPARSATTVVSSSHKLAPLSSSAFFSPESSVPKIIPLTQREQPRQRNRPGSGHGWYSTDADASPAASADAPPMRPAALQHSLTGLGDASSSSPESINAPLYEFVDSDAQSRCSMSEASAARIPAARAAASISDAAILQRAPLAQRLALFALDLPLLLVALCIVALASVFGWRPALPMRFATTTAIQRPAVIEVS